VKLESLLFSFISSVPTSLCLDTDEVTSSGLHPGSPQISSIVILFIQFNIFLNKFDQSHRFNSGRQRLITPLKTKLGHPPIELRKMAEIHDAYDTILILDFGSQVSIAFTLIESI